MQTNNQTSEKPVDKSVANVSAMPIEKQQQAFMSMYTGRMSGVLRWQQLDQLWQRVQKNGQWYIYKIGQDLPQSVASADELSGFITRTDAFLHEIHDSDYCGVVYTDSFEQPALLKIYHPKKMGAGCGSAGHTILPMWTLSSLPPADLISWAAQKDEKPSWWKFMMKTS